ncbi:MAG: hypothetical protein CME62_17655 [Halobacteriovoraceae bacterium]|nr:hypothetical protein [Halobacteriovoraceae bacterium]|tara:strand:- start:10516 stop:11238 length:723 start_codon:yes stop_codon:yes gene_type:complete
MQNPSKDLTFIVYNAPSPPRYIKVKKSIIKSLFILIPFMVILSITLSYTYSFIYKLENNSLRSNIPIEIQKLQKENTELSQNLQYLKKNNEELISKLSKGGTSESSISSMNLFTMPIGIEDLRGKALINIDDIKITTTPKEIKLHFNMENQSNEKLQGYISVVQFQENLIQFYPVNELSQKDYKIEYTQGESFGFSRFRPTTATFNRYSNSSVKYKIFIFSRTGNLLAYKQIAARNLANE